jgi:hypothetical protein
MNLVPRKLSDWFRSFFRGGLQAVAAEEAAEMQLGVLDTQAKVFQKVVELRRGAKHLVADGDEFDRELAAALDASLRETLELGKAMLTPMTPEERAEVLSRPLSDSGGFSKSLPPESSPAALTAPETNTTEASEETPEQPRRGRGRPKGSKNRPQEPTNNGHHA